MRIIRIYSVIKDLEIVGTVELTSDTLESPPVARQRARDLAQETHGPGIDCFIKGTREMRRKAGR